MTEEEKKAQREELLKEIEGQVKKVMENSQKESVKKSDLDKELEEINKKISEGLENEEIKALKESIDKMVKDQEELIETVKEQGTVINKLQEKGSKKDEPKTFRQTLEYAILSKKELFLTEKNDDYGKRLSMKEYFTEKGNQQSPTFTLEGAGNMFANKVAVDMLESNIVGANVNTVRLTDLDPNRVGIPLTIYPHVLQVLPSRSISKPYMSILVAYSFVDGTGTKTEGSASSKSSLLFKTVEFKAFFIATYATLSDETLDDLEEALDELSIIVPDALQDNIDGQILGSAGDDSSALAGILTANKKTDFVPGSYLMPSGEAANRIDVYSKMKLQCEDNKYMPDAIYLAPADVENLSAKKNDFSDSITDRRVVFNSLGLPVRIAGMRVIQSTSITANEAIVLDSRQTRIGVRKNMTMEIGYNGTDLTEGQKTAVFKIRVAFGVRDKAGIIYSDDVDAAVATIDQTA